MKGHYIQSKGTKLRGNEEHYIMRMFMTSQYTHLLARIIK